MNICTIGGNLVANPQLQKVGPYDSTLCKFALAVNTSIKKKDKWEDEVAFINCECWGKRAERIGMLFKGNPLAVTGRWKQDSWEDKEGNKRRSDKLVVQDFICVGGNAPRKQEPKANDDGDIPF